MMINRFKKFLIAPFRFENRINKILVIIFLLINGIVLFNAVFHDPEIGYDAGHHLKYIRILSQFRLPARDEAWEFFSPPLPYFLPSLLHSFGIFAFGVVAKFSQLLNVLFSIGLTFYLIKLCGIIRPNNAHFKITSLAFIGMLPVYYRAFAFVRGEPLLAFLSVLVIYETLNIFVKNNRSMSNILLLGLSLGLLMLVRQWGFFLFPTIAIFVAMLTLKKKQKWMFSLKATILSFFIALMVGGWFYLHLYKEYGTIRAFNRPSRPTFSFSNQPLKFYFGLGLNKLFSDPIRKSFPNQFFPMFYSEFWGDYWCYFNVYGKDIRNNRFISGLRLEKNLSENPPPLWLETNRYEVRKYLGRVNLISLFPSAILLVSVVLGAVYFGRFVINYLMNDRIMMFSLLQLVIVISFIGYFWFLIMYPSSVGATIKATYMLQVFPFVSILAGEFLQKIRQKSVHAYRVILVLLGITVLHNFPIFITQHVVC